MRLTSPNEMKLRLHSMLLVLFSVYRDYVPVKTETKEVLKELHRIEVLKIIDTGLNKLSLWTRQIVQL